MDYLEEDDFLNLENVAPQAAQQPIATLIPTVNSIDPSDDGATENRYLPEYNNYMLAPTNTQLQLDDYALPLNHVAQHQQYQQHQTPALPIYAYSRSNVPQQQPHPGINSYSIANNVVVQDPYQNILDDSQFSPPDPSAFPPFFQSNLQSQIPHFERVTGAYGSYANFTSPETTTLTRPRDYVGSSRASRGVDGMDQNYDAREPRPPVRPSSTRVPKMRRNGLQGSEDSAVRPEAASGISANVTGIGTPLTPSSQLSMVSSNPIEQAAALEDARDLPKKFPALYSSSGFDILGLLSKVVNRPNPQIKIGPVDMSCAILVVDAQQYNFPIAYASPSFSKLTGYSEAEILGQNCRFLQAPDGNVAIGSRRRYTDNAAVYYIKSNMFQGKESQTSLINYRKGGQPFINLVTIIPIFGANDEITYFVGLQIDLIEQPNAILKQMTDGTYHVDYSTHDVPSYIPPVAMNRVRDVYTPGSEKVPLPFPATSEIVELMGGAPSDATAAKRLWSRMLLQNSIDFIFALSLKGTFLYCSPAVERLLEYTPQELVGKNLTMGCHPLDSVAAMRDIKEASSGAPGDIDTISLIFRFRKKYSGWTWLEAQGKLHFDHGKSRKCFIMVARPRPVYILHRKYLPGNSEGSMLSASTSPPFNDQRAFSGVNDLWAKMSLDGLYLFASSSSEQLFGVPAEELVATSLYQHTKPENAQELTYALSRVRQGVIVTLRHEFQCRRGHYVSVVTTFWPGNIIRTDPLAGGDPTSDYLPSSSAAGRLPYSERRTSAATKSYPIGASSKGGNDSLTSGSNGAVANSTFPNTTSWYPPTAALSDTTPTFILSQTRELRKDEAADLVQELYPMELPLTPPSSTVVTKQKDGLGDGPLRNDGTADPSDTVLRLYDTVDVRNLESQLEAAKKKIRDPSDGATGKRGRDAIGGDDENSDNENLFGLLECARSTSWQFELQQLRMENKKLREQVEEYLLRKKKKKRKSVNASTAAKVCSRCQCKDSPEWRRGPDGTKSLCNACGLRHAKVHQTENDGDDSREGHDDRTSGRVGKADGAVTPSGSGPGSASR